MEFSGITLVTGAAGFMGSHAVEHLVKKGVRVRATARPRRDTSFFKDLGVEYIGADLTKPESLPPLFRDGVDRVFHFGAICNFSTPYAKLYSTNVAGVDHITRLALKHEVKSFVHVTSTSVYGYYMGKPFSEEDNRDPQDSYARSKRDGENIVFQRIREGLPAIIVRPCTVYGPRCNDGAGKAFSRPSSIAAIPGSGKQLLSNIRAEDVASAVEYLSGKEDAVGQVFNLAEEDNPTLEEALVLAAETFGTRTPRIRLPLFLIKTIARIDAFSARLRGKIPDLEFDAANYLYDDYVVDITKLKKAGYKHIYPSFRDSMQQLGEYFRTKADG
jgi:UDP-glucose 4-epimerase